MQNLKPACRREGTCSFLPGPSIQDLKQQYHKHGYVLLRQFFDRHEVEAVRKEAKEVFLQPMRAMGLLTHMPQSEEAFNQALFEFFEADFPAFVNCGKVCQHLLRLHQLSLDPLLINQLKELGLGFPVICTRPVMYFNTKRLAKSEVYYKTPPHQDWRSMQGSLNSLVVWVPLVDVDEQLGALKIIPGSHLDGLRASDPDEWYRHINHLQPDEFISVEVKAGDALFFSSFLVHASGDNSTDQIRWSCHFRYNDLLEPTYLQRRYPSPYIYKPQQELITPDFPSVEQVQKIFE